MDTSPQRAGGELPPPPSIPQQKGKIFHLISILFFFVPIPTTFPLPFLTTYVPLSHYRFPPPSPFPSSPPSPIPFLTTFPIPFFTTFPFPTTNSHHLPPSHYPSSPSTFPSLVPILEHSDTNPIIQNVCNKDTTSR